MNSYCNNCNDSCNTCNNDPCSCGKCRPAKYGCDFNITANPFDQSIWNVTICGATTKVKIPKLFETDTKLSVSYGDKALIYNAERHTDVITGDKLGSIIDLADLRDTDTGNADSCDLLVFNPGCDECGDGCKPRDAKWQNYHIPDAGDCEVEADEDGYYHVLIKDDCGCIRECKIPVIPQGSTTINYVRDSVPDDPDFPWYYGAYNDRINLHLSQNAARWFGKFDLELTINYGIQVVHSSASPNTNFRSLLVPVINGTQPNVSMFSSILQDQSTVSFSAPFIPWGSVSLRGSLTFIVPKGKEAYLHHEFRLRTKESAAGPPIGGYATNPLDGQRVPDDIAGQVDKMLYTASRLNALQVVVKPASGSANLAPVVDPERSQLDPAVDEYPAL